MNADHPLDNRLTKALRSVATASRIAPGWNQIRQRVDGGDRGLPDLEPDGQRDVIRRVLAVAAVVALVAGGLALTFRMTRSTDRDMRSHADPGERARATGWYVPIGLPENWKVESVRTLDLGSDCPCLFRTWRSADDRAAVTFQTSAIGIREVPTEGDEVDLGLPVPGAFHQDPKGRGSLTVSWNPDATTGATPTSTARVTAVGLDRVEVEAIARQLVGHETEPPAAVGPQDRLREREDLRWSDESRDTPGAWAELRTPAGNRVVYAVGPRGYWVAAHLPGRLLADGGLPGDADLLLKPLPLPAGVPDDPLEGPITVLHHDDADIAISMDRILDPDGDDPANRPPTDDEVRTVVEALRPATSSQWTTFLDRADEVSSALRGTSLRPRRSHERAGRRRRCSEGTTRSCSPRVSRPTVPPWDSSSMGPGTTR